MASNLEIYFIPKMKKVKIVIIYQSFKSTQWLGIFKIWGLLYTLSKSFPIKIFNLEIYFPYTLLKNSGWRHITNRQRILHVQPPWFVLREARSGDRYKGWLVLFSIQIWEKSICRRDCLSREKLHPTGTLLHDRLSYCRQLTTQTMAPQKWPAPTHNEGQHLLVFLQILRQLQQLQWPVSDLGMTALKASQKSATSLQRV